MLVALAALAFGADNPLPSTPIAQVRALEWHRGDPSAFEKERLKLCGSEVRLPLPRLRKSSGG